MPYTIKVLLVWFMHLFTWPLTIPSIVAYRLYSSERIFDFSAKLLSLIPGFPGQYIRTSFYKQTLLHCHYDLCVGFCAFFAHPNAIVGRKVVIGHFTIIGSSKIEDNVLIGSRVSIMSGKYQHDISEYDLNEKKTIKYELVVIGKNSWLGEGSLIMANIGKTSIVSAGSVVTKNTPDNIIAIGNPARFLKND